MKNNFKLINFIDITLEEKIMILEWRNNPEIKKWMYTQDIIELNDHLLFIDNLMNHKDELYFLVKKDAEYLGVIDFKNINYKNETTEFGLYANPDTEFLGIGRVLDQLSIEYAFDILKIKILKLEVFSDNMQVVNLHKKFKFLETGMKKVHNKNVICMELKYGNR